LTLQTSVLHSQVIQHCQLHPQIYTMPLHRLYVSPKIYSAEEKSAIADAITKVYSHLPAFYVVVLFISVDKEDYYVGGRRSDNFVRISVEHMARQFPK
jgi:phenylpyruvate tautomerase PptA (4-oxalocrotonate tautomerase family)